MSRADSVQLVFTAWNTLPVGSLSSLSAGMTSTCRGLAWSSTALFAWTLGHWAPLSKAGVQYQETYCLQINPIPSYVGFICNDNKHFSYLSQYFSLLISLYRTEMEKKVAVYGAPAEISANSSYHGHWLAFGLWQVVNADTITQLSSCVIASDSWVMKFISFTVSLPFSLVRSAKENVRRLVSEVSGQATLTSEFPVNVRIWGIFPHRQWPIGKINLLAFLAWLLSTPFQFTLCDLDLLYWINITCKAPDCKPWNVDTSQTS